MEATLRTGCLSLALLLGACGISQELYDARGTEIERLKGSLARSEAQGSSGKVACDARIAELEKKRQQESAAAQARLDELKKQAEQRAKQFQQLMGKLQSMVAAGRLKVEVRNGLMLVKLSDNILFDPGKIELKSTGKDTLKELAKILAGIEGRKFQVAGHTDNQPLARGSKFRDNWSLSTARAVEVVNFMIKEGGMPAVRLSAAGWADQLPVAGNETDDGRKQNRRIEVVLLPNIDELPTAAAVTAK
jgi:chemotaxis protein MotB